MATNTIKIATRKSKLALWQTYWVAEQIKEHCKDINIEFIELSTKGDEILDRSLEKIGGKGLFVKEIEEALLSGRADLAVHSLKDMPAQQPEELKLGLYCTREDYRDVLISKEYNSLASMPPGAVIGTSSIRRIAQLKIYRPDLTTKLLRGNINTRIDKCLVDQQYDGIILACAGVKRIAQEHIIREYLNISNFLPAPGQGIVTVEVSKNNNQLLQLLSSMQNRAVYYTAIAERAFNNKIGGSCQLPVAALAEVHHDQNKEQDMITIQGQIACPDGVSHIKTSMSDIMTNAADLGERLAETILNSGGQAIINNLH